MDESNALMLVAGVALGFLLGFFCGAAAMRCRRPDPSRGKKLRMDVTEEKDTHE
jgi:hypothetical protein